MAKVSRVDFRAIKAKIADKMAKRAQKQADNASLSGRVISNKIKRPKAKSLNQLEAILWEICSLYIRTRDKRANDGLCFYCGIRPIECAMHRIKRGRRATKYDERNLHGGCNYCNGQDGPFNRSQVYDAIFIKKLGVDLFLELEAKSREFCPRNRSGLLELTEHFRNKMAMALQHG